ncbi:MAG: hypothetical protein JJ873_14340 [Maricaulis sp.]|uniref:hypothetical protein n=1 Tax=Maricaulis sp. TaxID=1486257 RepID=UPI001B0F40E5|nr:hypothetical protein [Maricaulis sp.]MBO6878567.1 hypothetical protein [Maricaulis sp.]
MFSLSMAASAAVLFLQEPTTEVQDAGPDAPEATSAQLAEPEVEAAAELAPISERGEQVNFRRRFRSWELGEHSGFLGNRFVSIGFFGRRRNTARVELRVETGTYEDNPLTIVCIAQETRRTMGWIGWDRDDIVYGCDFTQNEQPIDRSFEMALKSSRFFGRTERAGEYQFGDTVLRFSMGDVNAGHILTETHSGYTVWHDDVVVGAIETGLMRTEIFVPAEPGELRENVILLMAILMTYRDPEEADGN